ncbi:MAG: hypothetical protein OJF47_003104 [Nitrospira sp.]|nr:MAG: hypothetical protein OJF47_003104 [Nitrospira sp.]
MRYPNNPNDNTAPSTYIAFMATLLLAGCGKTRLLRHTSCFAHGPARVRIARRMRKRAVQQGRSERRGESYSCRTVSL